MSTPPLADGSVTPIPVVVLGGSGYVAGELLRLLAGHPTLRLAAVLSGSKAGETVQDNYFHLRGTAVGGAVFGELESIDEVVSSFPSLGVFSSLPHGASAARIDGLLTASERAGTDVRVVDLSADFRHSDPSEYSAIYGAPHGAPGRLSEFFCGLPDLEPRAVVEGARHVAHPGCFTTAATLALAPLVAGGWLDPESTATVVAVTGSTGAGRTPTPTTHHPERRSDLFAYAPMAHRHEPEMRTLLARAARSARTADDPEVAAGGLRTAGGERLPEIAFVPQSGPFARGIYATISARLAKPTDTDAVLSYLSSFYDSPSSFVFVSPQPPRLQSVVGTNRCDLSVAVRGDRLVAFSAIDNLVKGAAGGGVQWMNRLFGLPDAAGLALPGLGWL